MTLGEMIQALSLLDENLPLYIQTKPRGVSRLGVSDLRSFRGFYDQLSVFHGDEHTTVGQFENTCIAANGATFIGYKGGEFVMDLSTDIWISDYGNADPVMTSHLEKYKDGIVIKAKIAQF